MLAAVGLIVLSDQTWIETARLRLPDLQLWKARVAGIQEVVELSGDDYAWNGQYGTTAGGRPTVTEALGALQRRFVIPILRERMLLRCLDEGLVKGHWIKQEGNQRRHLASTAKVDEDLEHRQRACRGRVDHRRTLAVPAAAVQLRSFT